MTNASGSKILGRSFIFAYPLGLKALPDVLESIPAAALRIVWAIIIFVLGQGGLQSDLSAPAVLHS